MPDRLLTPEKITQFKTFVTEHKKLTITAGIGFFLLLLILTTLSTPRSLQTNQGNNGQNTPLTQNEPGTTNTPASSLIYFAKNISTSIDTPPTTEIYSSDTSGNNIILRGQLKTAGKQILPLSPTTYLYIGDLGFLERGNSINKWDAKSSQSSVIYNTSQGYQIENYLLTPDKKSLIVWEETLGSTTEGSSRIISQEISNPLNKKILIEEPLSDQTKFPLFYSNTTNKLYLDSYSVNRKGKNRGVFEVSLDGLLQPISSLSVNNYSTQPILSPDGKYLAFTSYNAGTTVKLPAPAVPNEIFRESVRNPNQIKLLDLKTGTTNLLYEKLDGPLFDNLLFTKDGKSLIFRTLKIENDRTTTPLNYMQISLAEKETTPFADNPNGSMMYSFDNQNLLFGIRSMIIDSIGGLNQPDAPLLGSVYLYNTESKTYTKILTDDPIQILAIE